MFDARILNGLNVFLAVVHTGSFVKAAGIVFMSASGVSRAISRLESRSGIKLFDRTSRALKLTDEGRLFHEQIAPLLDQIGRIATSTGVNASTVRGKLRISTDAAFGHYLLAPRLGELIRRHPELRVELLVRDRITDLIAEGFDVAVRFGTPDVRTSARRLLMHSRVVTCASPEYLARVGHPRRPDELLDKRFQLIRMLDDVTGKAHPWNFVDRDNALTYDFDGSLVLNDAGSIVAATIAGVGISRVLDFMVHDLIERGQLTEVLAEWNRSLWPAYVYFPAGAHASTAMRVFVEFVAEIVQDAASEKD